MPQVIVKETTVYTLDELKELSTDAYNQAISKTIEWIADGFEPEFVTEDIVMLLQEDYPAFSLNCRTVGVNGRKHLNYDLEWDMDHVWIKGKGYTSVQRFLIDHRLRNKYRALWNVLKKYEIHFDVECNFGYGRDNGNANVSELISELEYHIGHKTIDRIMPQVEALEGEIEDWMGQIQHRFRTYLRNERDYQCSEQFAVEEADAHELKFTEKGYIYHG